MSRTIAFTGRVIGTRNSVIAGARVELHDVKIKQAIRTAFTDGEGFYRVVFNESDDPDVFNNLLDSKVHIRILSSDDLLVAEKKNIYSDEINADLTIIKIPGTLVKEFKPAVEPLQRLQGGIFDPDRLKIIDIAISQHFKSGTSDYNRYKQAIFCGLPDLAVFKTLLDDAWGVLDDNPVASRRFRNTLALINRRVPDSQREQLYNSGIKLLHAAGIVDTPCGYGSGRTTQLLRTTLPRVSNDRYKPQPDTPVHQTNCLIPPQRFLPVYAAAIHVSQDINDTANLLGTIETGLCGLETINNLVDAAAEYLTVGDFRRLEGVLGFIIGECGPDDGPAPSFPDSNPKPGCPDFPNPNPLQCDIERWGCLIELTIGMWRDFHFSRSEPYIISTITPDVACPRTTMVIKGSNFGVVPGKVCFPLSSASSEVICVETDTWSDTEAVVTVPDEAVAGEISLRINDIVINACEKVFTITRKGSGNRTYRGGRAAIFNLTINEERNDVCAEPGETVPITWSASIDSVVTIRVNAGANVLLEQSGLVNVDSIKYTVPNYTTEKKLTVTVTATNSCGKDDLQMDFTITVVPVIKVEGIEITQAIQSFWQKDVIENSLATIANKDTIVRVYISCDRKGFLNDTTQVTGTLKINETVLTPINGITPTSVVSNPFIIAQPRSLIDRTITDHTLNFRIPAALAQGTENLHIDIVGSLICGGIVTTTVDKSWTWTTGNPLRIRFVRIRDDGTNGSGVRPSEAECRFTIQRAFDLLPSPSTDIAPAWQSIWNTTHDITAGVGDLLDDLDDEHNCSAWEWLWGWTGTTECPDEDHAIWVGLTSPFNRGRGRRPGNTCVSAIYQIADGQNHLLRIKTTHEIGHNLGFKHVNRECNPGTIEGAFYKHPNNGNLQDVPFDPYWNKAISGSVQDFMSYGCARWVSGDSWKRLQDKI